MEKAELELIPILLTVLLVMLSLAALVIIVSFIAAQRIAKERERRREAELEHQRELLHTSLAAQERERERIATDLHDGLSSKLSVVRLALRNPAALEDAGQLGTLVDEVLATSRTIAHNLYPPLLREFGLVDALRQYVKHVTSNVEITVEAFGVSVGDRLKEELELQLFRIAQELLQNAFKHANATRIAVDVRISNSSAVLRIVDNGQGFDPKRAKGGLGMKSIESRVQLLHGRWRIKSFSQKGCSTLVFAPRKKQNDHGND